MTNEEVDEFFDRYGKKYLHPTFYGNPEPVEIEDLYQAFKARLKAEAALNVWPEGK